MFACSDTLSFCKSGEPLMSISGLRDWLSRTPAEAMPAFLLDSDLFARRLEDERRRSDRTGSKFSLALISPIGSEWTIEEWKRFATYLEQRLRTTDAAGLFDERRLGLVLPDTTSINAHNVADDVVDEPSLPATRYEMYHYPSHDSQPEDGQAEAPQDKTKGDAVALDIDGTNRIVEARPLEELFVRRLPVWKRIVDFVGAATGLVLLFPLLLFTALLVKLTSRGPVFFAQLREGLGGRPFLMYKFRSMVVGADALRGELREFSEQDSPAFKMHDDPHVTPIGHWLRKTSIDELPQLWNVLKGEMSLVGPRPNGAS
jgi:lipopolysaccharide/colanic/teichoic acid biosynthesis glycosyltransferase